MHDSWEEWHKSFIKIMDYMISQGIPAKVIVVDLNELVDYCIDKKIKNDGKARSQFVMQKQ